MWVCVCVSVCVCVCVGGGSNPRRASVINFTLAYKGIGKTRKSDISLFYLVDRNGSDRDAEDLISDSAAALLRETMCDKAHPSNLTASFKVMGGSGPICLSAPPFLQISPYTLAAYGGEAEIRHGSHCGVLVTQYRRDICWLTAVLQHHASPCIQTGKSHWGVMHFMFTFDLLLTQQLFQR